MSLFIRLLNLLKIVPIFVHGKTPSGRVVSFMRLIDEFISNITYPVLFFPFLLRYISYPRTETNIFPENLPLGPLVEQQTQSPIWGTFAQRVMEQPGGPNPRQGKKSDQAHPPIHPTKYSNTLQVSLQKLELSLGKCTFFPTYSDLCPLGICFKCSATEIILFYHILHHYKQS